MTRRRVNQLLGALLVLGGLAGAAWSVRAGLGQAIYFQAKFGPNRANPEVVDALAQRAIRLYPFQYRLCVWAAETAYYHRHDASGVVMPERLAMADAWCQRGLKLQPYNSELRLLDVRLTALTSPGEAARKWRPYLDWAFWYPYHHLVMVELACDAGRFSEAAAALEWVKGTPYEKQARDYYLNAWQAERTAMERAFQ